VDPKQKKIVASVSTLGYPDYLRYMPGRNELWVTEPYQSQIEVFSLPESGTPTPVHAATVSPGGFPEGIGVDPKTSRVFSHSLFTPMLLAIDAEQRSPIGSWFLSCAASAANTTHGNPVVDSDRGFVFTGCADARTA